jgi:hypothetical protein
MGEDISLNVRLGFTMLLIATFLVVVINLYVMWGSQLDIFTNKTADIISAPSDIAMMAMNNVEDVGAPTAYKLVKEKEGSIFSLAIQYIGISKTTADYTTLLDHAECSVKMQVEQREDGKYQVYIEEVKR